MGGIFGVVSRTDCVHDLFYGTDYHSHLGTKRGGLAVCTRGSRWSLVGGSAQRYTDGNDWRYVLTEVTSGERVVNVIGVHLHPYYPLSDRTLKGIEEHGQEVVRAQSESRMRAP